MMLSLPHPLTTIPAAPLAAAAARPPAELQPARPRIMLARELRASAGAETVVAAAERAAALAAASFSACSAARASSMAR